MKVSPFPTTLRVVAGEKLSQDKLQSADAVFSLGLVVIKQLQEQRIVTLFLNAEGDVEICPAGEYLHDAIPEEDAILKLLDIGYSDEQLMAYVKGRRARLSKSNG